MKYDYLIVGAGLFGCVFAHEATSRGKRCLVMERRAHVGGNCYTEEVEGITVHAYGAHVFHTDDENVWNYLNRFVKFNNFINRPLANYRGEIYNLPFNMNTFRQLWGVTEPSAAAAIISAQVGELEIKEPKNLEEQALKSVGRDVYEKLIKGYTEKQWGTSCDKLPAFIIKRLPVRFTYNNNYFDDKFQGVPEGGYSALFLKLLEGCDVRLNTDFNEWRKHSAVPAGRVVYTGALDGLFGYRLGKLKYRTLEFKTRVLDMPDFQGNAVVNYTSRDVPYTRIVEHKHFEFGTQPKTVITEEYPKEWRAGDEPFYTVNDDENNALAARYKKLADGEGYITGGRLAEYKYYDMDETVAAALSLAQKVLKN